VAKQNYKGIEENKCSLSLDVQNKEATIPNKIHAL
jgi:hypothetical protein